MCLRVAGSFGTLDEVSKTILPEAEGVSSRLVDSYTVKNYYVYDYIVNQQGRPEKHIKVITLHPPPKIQGRGRNHQQEYAAASNPHAPAYSMPP